MHPLQFIGQRVMSPTFELRHFKFSESRHLPSGSLSSHLTLLNSMVWYCRLSGTRKIWNREPRPNSSCHCLASGPVSCVGASHGEKDSLRLQVEAATRTNESKCQRLGSQGLEALLSIRGG